MNGRRARRWWLLALLVAGAAAAASGGGTAQLVAPGSHRFLSQVTADATVGATNVQAALPWRVDEGPSMFTRAVPERVPLSLAALLASLMAVPTVATERRARRRHQGPTSTLVALRRVVALRAPPCLRSA